MAPHGIYPASGEDNWIAIACRQNNDWSRLAGLIGEPWARNFEELETRLELQGELDVKLGEWTRLQDKFSLQDMLRELQLPVAVVQKPQERIDHDVTTAAFGLWPEVQHNAIGTVRVDGLPVHLSETCLLYTSPSPRD